MELFHNRGGNSYWNCAWCGEERAIDQNGCYVKVANIAIGIVCTGECEKGAADRVGKALHLHRQSVEAAKAP